MGQRKIFLLPPEYPAFYLQGMRGCIPLDEWIYSPTGLIQVKDVYDGMPILGGYVRSPHFFEDDVFKLTIDNVEFLATAEHPLWVIKDFPFRGARKGRWITVDEIYKHYSTKRGKDSRWYAQKYLSNQFKFNEITVGKSFAKLLGYLMSDGYFSETQSIKFTNVNKALLDDVIKLSFDVSEQLAFTLKFYQKGNGQDIMFTGAHGKNYSIFKDKLRDLGIIDRTTFGKLQLLQEDELAEFIKGYFNGDGTLNFANRAYVVFYVGIHQRQALELQFMLWRLDISSSIKYRKRATDHKGCWELAVVDRRSLIKLLSILEDRKYPEKFIAARKRIESMGRTSQHFQTESHEWLPITKIEKVGRHMVAGWQTLPSHEIISYDGLRTHNSGKSSTAERICEGYYLYHRFVVLDWWSAIDLENLFWCIPGSLDKDRAKDPTARKIGYPVLIIKPKETLLVPRNPLCRCGVALDAHGQTTPCKRPNPLIKTIDDNVPLNEIILRAYKGRRVLIHSPGLYKDPRDAVRTLGRFLGELPLLVRQEILPTNVSMILLLREMGNIVPQGLQNYGRGVETMVKRNLQSLVREARHLRIVLVGDFQRSSDIAATIVAQRDFMIFKKITTDLIPDNYGFVNESINYARAKAYSDMDWPSYYNQPSLSNLRPHECIVVFPDNTWRKIELGQAGFKHKKPSDSWPSMAHCTLKFLDPKQIGEKQSEKMRKKEAEAENKIKKLRLIHSLKQAGKEWSDILIEVQWPGFEALRRPDPPTDQERIILKLERERVIANARMAYNRSRTRGLIDPEGVSNANAVVSSQ